MRVRLSPNALHYVKQEGQYLRQHSPSAANAFAQRMKQAMADLSRFSQAGFEDEQSTFPGVRRLVRHGYWIDYMFRGDMIWVTAISSSVNTPLATPDDRADFEL
ncbi:MAG: type II toxin-antitoxin system RelE/ParE family toxin [Candidatus Devosia phytovorans]|uniref:Type II toxin-antitoxin system RelE/ParE family toxin n=1 Tax=Candidatus Devosia phytovorans TaxID=3121372 RepID=A0AAJ5VWX2_9HYPH|nr:type II toxin-antitoxin system RelE/ParE family toxin [Devosia sp.]WEK06401.1 MAG: type II toxin-antitoxin system RelE/ParE family toxin [Devosia sp.]